MYCPVFDEEFTVSNEFIVRYGKITSIPDNAVLVDEGFVKLHPELKPVLNYMRLEHFDPHANNREGIG
jgi:hypothetical protein